MPTSEELRQTFIDVAASQRANAAQIEALATLQGVLPNVQSAIDSLREQASIAEAAAEALANGDAVSIDELLA